MVERSSRSHPAGSVRGAGSVWGTGPEWVDALIEPILSSLDSREILIHLAQGLGQALRGTRAIAVATDSRGAKLIPPVEWAVEESDPALDTAAVAIFDAICSEANSVRTAVDVSDVFSCEWLSRYAVALEQLGICSVIAIATRFRGEKNGAFVLFQSHWSRVWSPFELQLVERVGEYAGIALHHAGSFTAMRRVEAESRSLAEYNTNTLVEYDIAGRFISANQQFERLVGVADTICAGWHFSDVIRETVFDADRERVEVFYRRVFQTRRAGSPLEHRVVNRETGRISWVIEQLSPIANEHGEIVGLQSLAVNVSEAREAEERFRESEARYRRLVEHSDAVIFHTDPEGVITYVSRRALDFFGVAPEDFVAQAAVSWFDLVHPEDLERVRLSASRMQRARASFDEEFRVINRVTGHVRWLLTRFVPVRGNGIEVEGWDGFGIDITERREAQEALDHQSKKIRALYTVSSAIRGFLEPSSIAARGLLSLCDATGADAGVCYLYPNRGTGRTLQLVTQHGLSKEFSDNSSSLLGLAANVAESNQSIVIPDLRSDARAGRVLYDEEALRSAVMVPISAEDERLGVIGVFSRIEGRFDGSDVMLVSAAANQIGLAARQANLFAAYRKQAKNLSALYRMSHELSRELAPADIFQQAFNIIRDELGLKRLWLGLLDETNTRIIGQAAHGPGFRRRLVEINVEVRGREHPIARVVTSKKPLVIDNPRDVMRELGVRKVFARLGINSMALVPLISRGQVLGVLAVQPRSDELALDDEELMLLSSLANEIAAILLTKRLEDRIQEADKMRAASLLAAGIAHNFNNLLQAILGQASLLEIQAGKEPKVARAVSVINEAASRGAKLVKQLLSFAHLEEPHREVCEVNDILERSREALTRSAGSNHRFTVNLTRNLPRVYVDPRQLLRVVTGLITNAGESMPESGIVELFTDRLTVDEHNPHFEVPYGEYVRIGVRDGGVGMDEETRRRCFEPFFTTKDVDPVSGVGVTGAGLGLAAAYAIARRNGGQLVVESRRGAGSLFTLYVPVARERGRRFGVVGNSARERIAADMTQGAGDSAELELPPLERVAVPDQTAPSGGKLVKPTEVKVGHGRKGGPPERSQTGTRSTEIKSGDKR